MNLRWAQSWIPYLFKMGILGMGLSWRIKVIGQERLEQSPQNGPGRIYTLWHNNITFCSFFLRNRNLASMISESSDGEMAAQTLELLGFDPVRGSTSKNGAKALIGMIKALRSGQSAAITPDGPRGPKYKLQNGIITLALKTGAPLIPVHIEATRQWIFKKSWDQHKIPKPFSTVVVHIGHPQYILETKQPDALEIARSAFESVMQENAAKTIEIVNQLRSNNHGL